MGVSRVINRRTAVLGLLLVILATAGFGFAASNSVEPSGAGDGDEAISGYNVRNIDYVLDALDPGEIAQVRFTLESQNPAVTTAPNSVMAEVVSGSGDWYTCALDNNVSPFPYVCTGGSSQVVDADSLRVVAANQH